MTVHASVFEIFSGHQARSASFAPQTSGAVVVSLVAPRARGDETTDTWFRLPQPVIPFSAYDKGQILVGTTPGYAGLGAGFSGYFIPTSGTTNYGVSDAVSAVWLRVGRIVGAQAAGLESNASLIAIDKDLDWLVGDIGRNAPPLAIIFGEGGSALLNFGPFQGVGPPPSASGTYTYAYSQRNPYQGLAHFCEFEDDPPDGLNNGSTIVRKLVNTLSNPTTPYVLGVDSLGNTISLDGCNYAAVGPDCAVYVEAGDVGPAPEQIPANVADNRPSNFRFHPSVFIRRPSYIRSVARQYRDPRALAAVGNGMPIRVSVRGTATSTRWLIIVDGAAQVVQLTHDADIIRPRDIWQQVWVPLIYGSSAVADVNIFNSITDSMAPGPAVSQIRLQYLEYARYLGPNGTDTAQEGIAV